VAAGAEEHVGVHVWPAGRDERLNGPGYVVGAQTALVGDLLRLAGEATRTTATATVVAEGDFADDTADNKASSADRCPLD